MFYVVMFLAALVDTTDLSLLVIRDMEIDYLWAAGPFRLTNSFISTCKKLYLHLMVLTKEVIKYSSK
jgi:hypothetical protein